MMPKPPKIKIIRTLSTIRDLEDVTDLSLESRGMFPYDDVPSAHLQCDGVLKTYRAYASDVLAGAGVFLYHKDLSFLCDIYVRRSQRRKGVASKLIRAILEDYPKMDLYVLTHNSSAIKLYLKLGLNAISIRPILGNLVEGTSTRHAYLFSNWQSNPLPVNQMRKQLKAIE